MCSEFSLDARVDRQSFSRCVSFTMCLDETHTEVSSAEERNTPRVICFSVFTLGCVQLDVSCVKRAELRMSEELN